MADFTGTSGNDDIEGTNAGDTFKLGQGGRDTVLGKGGIDIFMMGDAFDARDAINGGADFDRIEMKGDYSAGLIFRATTMTGIEVLKLKGAFDYNLTLDDGNVGANDLLEVDAGSLGPGGSLSFDGSDEKDGRFDIEGSEDGDTIIGGSQKDQIDLVKGGNDIVDGRGGNDALRMDGAFDANDIIDGGGGFDTVKFYGSVTFNADTLTDVERLELNNANFDSILVMDDANVGAGKTLEIDGSAVGFFATFSVDGSQETDGHFDITSGLYDGSIAGGALADTIYMSFHSEQQTVTGGGGADDITCTGGQNFLAYTSASESTGTEHDVIHGFNADGFTLFDTNAVITDYDGETGGEVNAATFDADIADALDGFLEADHAATVNSDAGDLAGRSYVVIDANGDAAYTAGDDYLFEITGYTGTLGMSDFT